MPRLKCYRAIQKLPEDTYYESLTEVRMNSSLLTPTFNEVILMRYDPTPVKLPRALVFPDLKYFPDMLNYPYGIFTTFTILTYIIWEFTFLDNYFEPIVALT
jgi:hypothetical protein